MKAASAHAGRFGGFLADALARFGAAPVELPPELASNQRNQLHHRAVFGRTPAGSDLRGVHLLSPRVEVVNLFLFPPEDLAFPVHAMELVLFGAKPVVGVVDCIDLSDHAWSRSLWRTMLEAAHAKHTVAQRASDPPHWFEECRSGLDFFIRPETAEGLETLAAVDSELLSNLAAAEPCAPRLSAQAAAAHALQIAAYKRHHRLNSPGLPFLHRSFGPDWTDRFLRFALFA